MWGGIKENYYEDGDEDSDAGIENELIKMAEVYDLSSHVAGAGTTFTSGFA